MSKHTYGIHNILKGPHQPDKGTFRANAVNIQSMPKLELNGANFKSRTQLYNTRDDSNKENKDLMNLIESKEKGQKRAKPENDSHITRNKNSQEGTSTKPRISNELRNPCPSPHFNRDWSSPSNSRNYQTGLRSRPDAGNGNEMSVKGHNHQYSLRGQNSQNRYREEEDSVLIDNHRDTLKHFGAGNMMRKSTSLEDLRKVIKPAGHENKRSLCQDPRDYAFSFGNKKLILGENLLGVHTGNRKAKGDFISSLNDYISYFEKDQQSYSYHRQKRIDDVESSSGYVQLHRQLKEYYEEIVFLNEQVEKLRNKKNNLAQANNFLISEVNNSRMREQKYKEKLQTTQAQVICLKKEASYYKNKLKEVHRQLKQEQMLNENNLLSLREMLSSNINLALENKLNGCLVSQKGTERHQRSSIKGSVPVEQEEFRLRRNSRKKELQKYLHPYEEKVEGLGRYGNPDLRRESNVARKESLSPWVSLHNISPYSEAEEEIGSHLNQNLGKDLSEENQYEHEKEDKQREREEIKSEEESQEQGSEILEERNEIERSYMPNSTSQNKRKHTKLLKKKLGEVFKTPYSNDMSASHRQDGCYMNKNVMRYREEPKRSHVFGGEMKPDDIDNYSFSLPNSE